MAQAASAPPVIATGRLGRDALAGEIVVVTGAGGGIGFEAARSALWLGATVVVAELDETRGGDAGRRLSAEHGAQRVVFEAVDVGDEAAVRHLADVVLSRFGRVDAVLNNAAYAPAGSAVVETPVAVWDRSYAVNLRGPALLARAFLPGMIARRHGVFVCVSSSGGPFLAPYETVKAAQLALAGALDAELEGTGVLTFTIGPGLVPTPTASAAIEQLAPRLGTTVEAFWEANRAVVVSVEAAGAGFAAAIALADRYAGQEISSTQALVDAGIDVSPAPGPPAPEAGAGDLTGAAQVARRVCATLSDQSTGWRERSFFERQWMLRDFRQRVGMPVERCLEALGRVQEHLAAGDLVAARAGGAPLQRLAGFYRHLGELARGYVKDRRQRDEQLALVAGWERDATALFELLSGRR